MKLRLKFWEASDLGWDGVLYRLIMRIIHKFHLHYAEPSTIDKTKVWCKWCGLRGFVWEYNENEE